MTSIWNCDTVTTRLLPSCPFAPTTKLTGSWNTVLHCVDATSIRHPSSWHAASLFVPAANAKDRCTARKKWLSSDWLFTLAFSFTATMPFSFVLALSFAPSLSSTRARLLPSSSFSTAHARAVRLPYTRSSWLKKSVLCDSWRSALCEKGRWKRYERNASSHSAPYTEYAEPCREHQ